MSLQANLSASFAIVNINLSAGGAGVAIWQDSVTKYLYVATAYHVVSSTNKLVLIDYKFRKYSNIRPIILDKTYDFAILEVRDTLPVVNPITISTVYPSASTLQKGSNVYVIGWPKLYDFNSVSTGCIRSDKWNINGCMNQILIATGVLSGNSGGGVFLADSHECIGVISWGYTGVDILNGVVPYSVLYESLLFFMYRPSVGLLSASPIFKESYYLGVYGLTIDPFLLNSLANVNNTTLTSTGGSALITYGSAGMIVLTVANPSPAYTAGFRNAVLTRSQTFDILWAIRLTGTNQWIFFNEENSLDSILYTYYSATPNLTTRPLLSSRATINSVNDVSLSTNLSIELLTSRLINGVHNKLYVIKRLVLGKRGSYGLDKSTFGNEFLSAKRNEMSSFVRTNKGNNVDALKLLVTSRE